ncbi:probable E3 ubiquitin-protein ligase RHA4A [Hevea brasiliensis]|uniref:probable E3 ubiquitin-protein ligase RHA4A n=1 Tax=Hevea brasiliensis TaxID=3981 RepID=UPI0025F85BF1|nr:probable E3 ubiquitin-protein ligase RHA4A [Hevea brasiliensis]
MGLPPNATPPHLYPQALQLKLYQTFIFSIPILFSIILLLLFYLFYLKRKATSSSLSSSPTQILPITSNQSTQSAPSVCQIGLKKEIKDKLPIVLFDEELRTREPQCCVCLGEFEIKEELLQIPTCKHVFHIECIHHWLHSNSTCPLCRSFVIPTTKIEKLTQSGEPEMLLQQDNPNSNHHPQIAS